MAEKTTVHFNVGGSRYEVARSLIESYPETMLARMTSETWKGDASEPVFIERDGKRFQYCLDYMRDKHVFLPLTVAREAFLEDLVYFGFEDIDKDAVKNSPSIVAAVCMAESEANYNRENDLLKKKILKLQREQVHLAVAYHCFKRYNQADGRNIQITIKARDIPEMQVSLLQGGRRDELDKFLKKHGLFCVNLKSDTYGDAYYVTVGVLSDM